MHRQHARPAALHPLALAVLLALGGTLAHTPARAQSAASAQTTAYDLPAGPLDATLTGIARRAGRIIVIDPALVSGRTAGPVRGNLTLEQITYHAVQQSLVAHNGNQTAAARQLGISRTTLWRYLSKDTAPEPEPET